MIKVLMISTDEKILEEGSSVSARMKEYGTLFSELHIVVLSKKRPGREARQMVSDTVFAYPTNSRSKLSYVCDAKKIGARIIQDLKLSLNDSVITTQDPFETGIVGRKLSRLFSIPLHVQIHTDFMSPYFRGANFLNRIRICLSRKTLLRAKAVRAVSERIKISLSSDIQAKTSVLPIYADVVGIKNAPVADNLRKKYPQFGKIILMASRLTKEKDFRTALRANASEAFARQGVGLVIVGSGPEEGNIQSLIQELGIADKVIMESWADHATLISYMKTCDVFLSTSLFEGYGLSMLEAHAAGATIVATDAGIAGELVNNICKPDDPQCLSKSLGAALSGSIRNKTAPYLYSSKGAFLEAYKADIERALL